MAVSFAYLLQPLQPTAPPFQPLLEESRRNGFDMLARLGSNWTEGGNRFDAMGEMLLGAWRDGELAGVCGLNIDPYVAGRRQGRVRHLYVGEAHRRRGVGAMLVGAVIDAAGRHFSVLNTRAPVEAHRFYESLGFQRVQQDFVTHRLMLDGRLHQPALEERH
ncbi:MULTISPECIES: GNAT family N-acetyltransferase [Phyllobacteriaceae]|jgi:GNAT superfamily N-acetyltransferase|uniref:GNAT family N-acetyltransferase n=1 Tax=Mesorhizobium hungaricum TaxID=1566387 RepID=A0A1C2EEX6_9HYPH|nr:MULTISPECIES: GNAT family N-acetyltransferase [Mesorhizobium]MDQ0329075.1 GNAT superfamily N-acetyltransferase [Mesorhizobium sp. YL-MeA3-2017]OCX25467.1 GNAT family N-acetyltransferase [Mesorhizobium hungaricum]